MPVEIFQEIDGSHTFVKDIIRKYYGHISETDRENFDNIRVYNTVEDPLFNGIDVYYCLKGTKKHVDRMYNDLFDDEVIRQQKVSGVSRPINLITEYGLIHACYLYKTDIAIIFQKFMREVIKQLKNTGIATVVDAHKQLAKSLEVEKEKRRDAEIINKQNIFLQEAYCNDFSAGDPDTTELNILRRQHLTTYYVYLVDWQFVNSKYWKTFPTSNGAQDKQPRKKVGKSVEEIMFEDLESRSCDDEPKPNSKKPRSKKPYVDITQPHKNGIQEKYEMDFINKNDLVNDENEEYYFNISAKEHDKENFKFVMTIQLDKIKHYTEMLDYIMNGERVVNRTAYPINSYEPSEHKNNNFDDTVLTPVAKVYKTTYDTIVSARSRSYIHLNRSYLIGSTRLSK
jgi:hypothetical protein